jgi:hypothetical protein
MTYKKSHNPLRIELKQPYRLVMNLLSDDH